MIWYGNRYEPVSLNRCRRPPFSPAELMSAFGDEMLRVSVVVCEYVYPLTSENPFEYRFVTVSSRPL